MEDLLERIATLEHNLVTDLEVEERIADEAYIAAIENGASHASAEREGRIASREARFRRLRTQAELKIAYNRFELEKVVHHANTVR
ncbi:MAG: hypothetical protein NZL87_05420 [Thermomicrobium sp.]|nr:hypothetical protein [Thermomicrobium sp.]